MFSFCLNSCTCMQLFCSYYTSWIVISASRFQPSSLAFEHGRLRRPGRFLPFLRVVPSRREGTTRRNGKKKTYAEALPLPEREV
jgi:hypothetical protein